MPSLAGLAFRAFLVLAMAGYVFCMYCLARTLEPTLGFDGRAVAIATLGALGLTIPLFWIVGLPELPEIYTRHVRARRRWRAGECPDCGYALGGTAGGACPECGRPIRQPEGYDFRLAILTRFLAMVTIAFVLGCAAGELWVLADESSFEREAEAAMQNPAATQYERSRRWPAMSMTMTWIRGRGLVLNDLAPQPREDDPLR